MRPNINSCHLRRGERDVCGRNSSASEWGFKRTVKLSLWGTLPLSIAFMLSFHVKKHWTFPQRLSVHFSLFSQVTHSFRTSYLKPFINEGPADWMLFSPRPPPPSTLTHTHRGVNGKVRQCDRVCCYTEGWPDLDCSNYNTQAPREHARAHTSMHTHTCNWSKQSPWSQWDVVCHEMRPVTERAIICSTAHVSRWGMSEAKVSIVKVTIAWCL